MTLFEEFPSIDSQFFKLTKRKMKINLIFMTCVLIIMIVLCCQGFELNMDRMNYLLNNRTYCGPLRCEVDTVTDANMARLIKMNIYTLKNEQLLATLLPEDSEIQSFSGDETLAIGSISHNHGECDMYFSDVSYCLQTAYTCKVHFKNANNEDEVTEKMISPPSSDPLGNPAPLRIVEPSAQSTNPLLTSGENPEHYFDSQLSDLEDRISSKLNLAVTQIFSKINGMACMPGKLNINLDDAAQKLNGQGKERKFERSMAAIVRSLNSAGTTTGKPQMDDVVDNVERGNVSVKANEATKLYDELEMTDRPEQQVVGFIQALIDSKCSTLEGRVTEMVTAIHHMNEAVVSMNKGGRGVNERLRGEELMGKIEQAVTLLDSELHGPKMLRRDVLMEELVREMKFVNTTMKEMRRSLGEANGKSGEEELRNERERPLSALVESLKELRTGQRSMESLLVNVATNLKVKDKEPTLSKCITSGVDQSPENQLKCERGMSTALGPRMITSLDNKIKVLCDTETDGGGWIILQRRVKGDVSFARNWTDYKQGFGSFHGDFWLGNDIVSHLTTKENYSLRIDMRVGTDAYNVTYDSFKVKDESDKYSLRLSGFRGSIRDSFGAHNNMAFSTLDRDNDRDSGSCAWTFQSGWWYNACYHSHLNGVWGSSGSKGIKWVSSNHNPLVLSYVEMKVRRVV